MSENMTLEELHDFRQTMLDGKVPTADDLKKAVRSLRRDRVTAKPQQKKKAKPIPISLFDIKPEE